MWRDCNHRQNLVDKIKDEHNPKNARIVLVCATLAMLPCILFGTLVHPYLLADNRHYTFYIWKDILGRSVLVRLVLAPVYAVLGTMLVSQLTSKWGRLWTLNFVAALAMALVPAWLVEFRYFIPGAFLLALQVDAGPERLIAINALALAAVNAVTVYVFAAMPFTDSDSNTARFMW